jgi:hypothetical protein
MCDILSPGNFGKFGKIRNFCMKLTRRQEEFVTNLVDLSDEFDGPIHYSMLAERLGVSPFTAYDMLCLLEEKGMVTSEYQLATGKNGPGRAERLFCPSDSIEERKKALANEFGGRIPEREERKHFFLSGIQSGEVWKKELAEEILARVPDIEHGEISYCVEIMTIAALRLQRSSGRRILLDYLPEILPDSDPTPENLSLLGGFAFGLLAQECARDDEWIQKLFAYIQQYLKIVLSLTPQERAQLAQALSDVFTSLTQEALID